MQYFRRVFIVLILPVMIFAQEGGIDSRFHTLDEIYAQLAEWQEIYPQLLMLDTLGYSTNAELPIIAAKISDNPHIREDEPRTLLIGQHHAEEILGNEIVLSVMNELLKTGMQSPQLRAYIQHMESWFIVTMNPEGLQVVMAGDDVTYRKNYTDNNGNGAFDFEPGIGMDIDGVDMNRNYDFCWTHGDSLYQGDYDYYRGPTAFSEDETRVVADFALQQDCIYSFAYHSARSGTPEIIYYPWNFDAGKNPPDYSLIAGFAQSVANKILRQNGISYYRTYPGTSRKGNAHNWMYAKANTVQLLIEVGTNNLQPDSANIEQIVNRNKEAVYYMYDRTIGYEENRHLLTGHITNAVTGEPVEARVTIAEKDAPYLEDRESDAQFGRYWRPLLPGTYTIQVRKMGYYPTNREIVIGNDALTEDFALEPRPVHQVGFQFADGSTGDTLDAKIRLKYLSCDSQNKPLEMTTWFSTMPGGTVELDSGMWRYEAQSLDSPDNYLVRVDTVTVRIDTTVQVLIPQAENTWAEDFSNLSGWDAEGDWTVYTQRTGESVVKSQSGMYYFPEGADLTLTYSEPIPLDGVLGSLALTSWHELEWAYDTAAVEITTAGDSNWVQLKAFTGHPDSGGAWSMEQPQQHFMDLTPWMGESIQIRFRLWADGSQVDRGLHIHHMDIRTTSTFTGNQPESPLPAKFSVGYNYPNPFNPETVIPFSMNRTGEITLRIYNLLGQEVYARTLSITEPGHYKFHWNGRNSHGAQLSSGMYLGRVQWKDHVEQRKLMLIR